MVQVWDRQDEGMPGFGDACAMWVPSVYVCVIYDCVPKNASRVPLLMWA